MKPPHVVRILALDIDGTLLHDDGTMSDRVVAAVHRARLAGVRPVLCTGRAFHTDVGRIADLLHMYLDVDQGVDPQAIVNNGGAAIDLRSGAVRWEQLIPREFASAIMTVIAEAGATPLIEQAPSVGPEMFTGGVNPIHPAATWYAHAWMRKADLTVVPAEALARSAENAGWIGACGSYVATLKVRDQLQQLNLDRLDLTWSGSWLPQDTPNHVLGIRQTGVHKASGLARFALEFGATLADCVAIGDELNDLELLAQVGFGIAMGQSPSAVKSTAKVTVASNEDDGVVEAIERWVIPFAQLRS